MFGKKYLLLVPMVILGLGACQSSKVMSIEGSGSSQLNIPGGGSNLPTIVIPGTLNGTNLNVIQKPTSHLKIKGNLILAFHSMLISSASAEQNVPGEPSVPNDPGVPGPVGPLPSITPNPTIAPTPTPTPTPIPTPTPNPAVVITPLLLGPAHVMFYNTQLRSVLSQAVGTSEFNNLLAIESSYLSNPGATLPNELSRLVTISLNCGSVVLPKTIMVHDILKSMNSSILCTANEGFLGEAVLPAQNSTDSSTLLSSITNQTRMHVPTSNLLLVGGSLGTVQSRKIAAVVLNTVNKTFQIQTLTNLSQVTGKAKIAYPYTGSLATAAGKPASYIGNYLLVANVNSLNKITGFESVNLNVSPISVTVETAVTCANVIAHFTGYTCN